MYKNKTFLAIILARGGSKRLPKKNILELKGKPLIAYSIEAGLSSKYIDQVVVSSDSQEILDIAGKFGVEIIKRPEKLAYDEATSFDATVHAIESTERHDYIILLQPTSPLRDSQHIDEALELLFKTDSDAVISVCEAEHSPIWSNTLPENGDMSGFLREEVKNKRSQDLPTYYRVNGALYLCKTDSFLKEKTFFLEGRCVAYKMDRRSSVDIDDEIDFKLAEVIMAERWSSQTRRMS